MNASFKILSDFDGVWTETHHEAEALFAQICSWCADLMGSDATVESDLTAFRRDVEHAPMDYGWAPDGRISAFADEDPLCELAGLCDFIARAESGVALRYRRAIEQRWDSVRDFGERAFTTAMTRFRTQNPPAIATDAREQLLAVKEAGAEVVVVSNSDPGKLLAWFQSAGIDASEQPGHELRIRGSAGKQTLGADTTIAIGDRRIHVDRPLYRTAIEQERPAIIIGDIFSLDLSLPHHMRTQGHPAAPKALVLRCTAGSPAWAAKDRAAGAIDHVVDRFGDLVAVLETEIDLDREPAVES